MLTGHLPHLILSYDAPMLASEGDYIADAVLFANIPPQIMQSDMHGRHTGPCALFREDSKYCGYMAQMCTLSRAAAKACEAFPMIQRRWPPIDRASK